MRSVKPLSLVAALLALSLGASAYSNAQSVKLEVKWPVGKRIVKQISMNQDQTIEMPQLPQPMEQKISQVQEVAMSIRPGPDGKGRSVEMEFLRIKMDMNAGFFNMSFNSDDPDNQAAGPLAAMGAMVGKKLTMILDEAGEVTRVEGADKLIEGMGGGNPMLKNMLNEETFKQMINPGIKLAFKGEEKKVGDTWPMNVEMPMPMFGIMVVNANYLFKAMEAKGGRDCAVLTFKGSVSSKPDPNAKKVEGMPDMKMEIKDGTMTGTIWFDPKLGMDVEQEMTQNMTMVMDIPVGATPQSVNAKMKQKMSQKLIKIEDLK